MQVLIVWRSVCPVCTCLHRNTATFVWSTISLTTKTTTWPPESPSLTTPSPWAASWSSLVVSTRYQVSRIIQSSVNRILKTKAGLNRTCVYQQRPVHIRQLLNTHMNVVWRPVEIAGIWLEDIRTTFQVSATTKTRACASVEPDVDRLSSRYLVYHPNCIARDFFPSLGSFLDYGCRLFFRLNGTIQKNMKTCSTPLESLYTTPRTFAVTTWAQRSSPPPTSPSPPPGRSTPSHPATPATAHRCKSNHPSTSPELLITCINMVSCLKTY